MELWTLYWWSRKPISWIYGRFFFLDRVPLRDQFLGVGVDLRVHNTISIGLPETPENLFQEGGRPMRGSLSETQGQQGYSFFLHKGALGTN
jgi:hypothetical protein